MLRTGARRPVVVVAVGTRRIGDRAVLMAVPTPEANSSRRPARLRPLKQSHRRSDEFLESIKKGIKKFVPTQISRNQRFHATFLL